MHEIKKSESVNLFERFINMIKWNFERHESNIPWISIEDSVDEGMCMDGNTICLHDTLYIYRLPV